MKIDSLDPIAATIPREFLGSARQLRLALAADDLVTYRESGRIATPFAAMFSNGTTPRPEMLARAASAWTEKIPVTGRLRLEVDLKRKSLHIREMRILAAEAHFTEWPEGQLEPGIMLAVMELEVSPTRFRFEPMKLAGLSQHALARWFQRSFKNSRENLKTDLRRLAASADDARLPAGTAITIPAGDGAWVGSITELEEPDATYRILSVRSFLTQ